MTATRKDVHSIGDWGDDILWYARGVQEMKKKPFTDVTSWLFYGGIHGTFGRIPGVSDNMWKYYGIIDDATPLPSQADTDLYLNQCQHGTWYFLPWHRGYVLGLERVLRQHICDLGGPADWAMPYWNYFENGQQSLPVAFASNAWPDGGDNPLYTPDRFGPNGDGTVWVPWSQTTVNLNGMKSNIFTGTASGGDTGFGGIKTGFSHGGRTHGRIETQPHDYVHVYVGGQQPGTGAPGLMGYPPTAALDPIFFLHHCNIDRLWSAWLAQGGGHADPTEDDWLKGPAAVGQRPFAMPKPDGSTYSYTPADMVDTEALGYVYDNLTSGTVPRDTTGSRLARLAGADTVAAEEQEPPMAKTTELVGAHEAPVALGNAPSHARIKMDETARRKVSTSLSEAARGAGPVAPDRVYLNLENVRGLADAVAFSVYVGVPAGAEPQNHPERHAGGAALFGISQATDPDGEHGGQGLNYVFDITDLVDNLHLSDSFDLDELSVHLVPEMNVPDKAEISVGRISIYREGD